MWLYETAGVLSLKTPNNTTKSNSDGEYYSQSKYLLFQNSLRRLSPIKAVPSPNIQKLNAKIGNRRFHNGPPTHFTNPVTAPNLPISHKKLPISP